MGIKESKFTSELKRFNRLGLDSSILIYHLEDIEPYSELTEITFTTIAGGARRAVLSTISVTELLIQPFADGEKVRVDTFERFILSLPNTVLVPPDYTIARVAARLSATYDIRTPDALIAATALEEKAQAFLTNDSRLAKIKNEGIAVLILNDYL